MFDSKKTWKEAVIVLFVTGLGIWILISAIQSIGLPLTIFSLAVYWFALNIWRQISAKYKFAPKEHPLLRMSFIMTFGLVTILIAINIGSIFHLIK